MSEAISCSMFEGCSAPVCPKDAQSLEQGIWYPDEPICQKRGLKLKWLAIQKRIARKARDVNRYFTLKDFQRMVYVGSNPVGHNPDISYGASSPADFQG